MRVFVTGSTGFVGSHVVERLQEAGHEPVCLVRKTSDTTHLDECGVCKVVGRLGDTEALADTLAGVDAVVHIAGVIKARRWEDFYQVNGVASRELAALAAQVNPKLRRYVHVSSIAAQGPSAGAQPRPLDQDPEPVSHYGRSKLQGERGALSVADAVPVTVIRPPAVYGPRDYEMFQAFKMASLGLAPVYGRGQGLLSLVHVFDLADAIVRCLEVEHSTRAVFTVDDGHHYSWLELTDHIAQAVGRRALTLPLPPAIFHLAARASEAYSKLADRAVIFTRDKVAEMSQPSWVCGHQAITEAIGWQPQWPLERGAEQAARWYREAGWL